jgi:hypothetical protein
LRRLLVLVPLLVLALCAGAQAKPALGIADQKPETFLDPRLDDLNLRYSRLYVPWDVLKDRHSLAVVDAWLVGSKVAGLDPLITISRSRIPSRISVNPTPAQLSAEFKKWRTRWPGQMSTVSTWNEANLGKKPEMVAKWWLALRRTCPTCTILGADLLDEPKVLAWTTAFVKAAKRSPTIWGLHAYNDANTFTTNSTKALLKSIKGNIWITETGGVANRVKPIYKFSGCGVAHQTKATSFLLKKIAMLSPRIKRIYIFNWGLGDGGASFDSALVDEEGRERPSLNLVRTYLGQPRIPVPAGGTSPELARCKKGTTKIKATKRAPKKAKAKK